MKKLFIFVITLLPYFTIAQNIGYTNESVRLREEANTYSRIIRNLKPNEKLILYNKISNFYSVKVKNTGEIGYVHVDYISSNISINDNTDNSTTQTTTVISANCGKCGRSVSKYSKIGDVCPYCRTTWGGSQSNKIKQTYNSSSSISDNYSSTGKEDSFSIYEATITIKNTNLRSAPNFDAEIICTIPKESEIKIVKKQGDWVKIHFNGKSKEDIQKEEAILFRQKLIEDYPEYYPNESKNFIYVPTYKSRYGWLHKSNIVE